MGKRISAFLLICLMLAGNVLMTNASNIDEKVTDVRLEQAHATMPKIEAYYYLDDSVPQDAASITASFAGEGMQVTSVNAYDKKSGIDYYILLDISASISKKYFDSIKTAIIDFQSSMKKNDRLTLITFGDEVNIVFEDKSKADDCSSQIQALENKDMTTALFQALQKTAAMADTDENAMKRSIALTITDGEDFSTNKATSNEALQTLQEAGLPVYSMAVEKTAKGADNQYINDFGEFTRSTGGTLSTFTDETAQSVMESIQKSLFSAKIVTLQAPTNQSYQNLQPLTLTFGDQASSTINVLAKRAEADNTIPTATAAEVSNKSISVTFSEKVLNAEKTDSYIVKDENEDVIPIASVSYSENDGYKAILMFENEFFNGDYQITYQNICDDSAEANQVAAGNKVTIEDGQKEDSALVKWFKNYWMLLVAVLTILVVALIIWLAYRRVKKNKGVVVVDGKAVFSNQVDVKQRVELEQPKPGHEIHLRIRNGKDSFKDLDMVVTDSLFVGRSDMCDLYFSNDNSLSKQHFVIEEGADGFYIQDLQSANGTMINGVKIHQRRKLQQGDTIHAGLVDMQIRW